MKDSKLALLSAATLLVGSAAVMADEPNGDLGDAITSGKATVALRTRYEHVDQDSLADDADALSARLRLNYQTGAWEGLSGFVEYDYVGHLLRDFNSGGGTSPAKARYPVVADPKGSDLNQLYIDYRISGDSKVRVGRQRILLDNQRFVGGVGWRQNEQTYDGLTFSTKAIQKTDLSYSYVGKVRRIFGERVAAGQNDVDAHLLHANVAINDDWTVTPYYYHIDNEDVAAFSTSTFGARLAGNIAAGNDKISLAAEFATQSDLANNPVNYTANYLNLSGTWALANGLSLGLAYENLEGNSSPGMMFRTPLATLHAFQGWADQFLTTPAAGIDDVFATVKYKAGKWNFTGVYHDFSSDVGSINYGSEIDLSARRGIGENYRILFKGAFFAADTASFQDVNKFWIVFSAHY